MLAGGMIAAAALLLMMAGATTLLRVIWAALGVLLIGILLLLLLWWLLLLRMWLLIGCLRRWLRELQRGRGEITHRRPGVRLTGERLWPARIAVFAAFTVFAPATAAALLATLALTTFHRKARSALSNRGRAIAQRRGHARLLIGWLRGRLLRARCGGVACSETGVDRWWRRDLTDVTAAGHRAGGATGRAIATAEDRSGAAVGPLIEEPRGR